MGKSAWVGARSADDEISPSVSIHIPGSGNSVTQSVTYCSSVFLENESTGSARVNKSGTGLSKPTWVGIKSTDDKIGFSVSIHISRPSDGDAQPVAYGSAIFLIKHDKLAGRGGGKRKNNDYNGG